MFKEVTKDATPAQIRQVAKDCARACGCTDGLTNDDVIVVDTEDLKAILKEFGRR